MSNPIICNVEPVDMPSPQHGRVIPLAELRPKSDREKQLDLLGDLAPKWGLFCNYRIRVMQQIATVLIREGGTLEGRNLEALEAIHTEFCRGEVNAN